jgi:hypothetical protein
MLKRSIWCTIWILGALLIFASLDAVPDLPAVNPHTVTVKVPGPSVENLCGPSGNGSSPNLLAQSQTQGTIFIRQTEPDCPTNFTAQTRLAADPSPPASS